MRSRQLPQSARPRGFSLVELLVASTIAVMAMAAVASLLGTFGRAVSQSQTLIDLNARIRSTAWRLRQDLRGATAPPNPWLRPEANAGYLQIVESGTTAPDALAGDCDDRLMLTTSSLGSPFFGRLQGAAGFESSVAEVVWFCVASGQTFEGQPLFNLHRRQLLVSGAPGAGVFLNGVAASIDRNLTDVSCRNNGGQQVANSLGDLTIPANRFWNVVGGTTTLQGDRLGEDVVLANVIAFDVRTYSTGSSAYVNQQFNTNYDLNTGPDMGSPLPGLQVQIRCVEPVSRQIRQVTVVHSFEEM
jgi:prepilin-type N-terminal cleavage/methylation domain-containing protein